VRNAFDVINRVEPECWSAPSLLRLILFLLVLKTAIQESDELQFTTLGDVPWAVSPFVDPRR
jgi:hypothetical protein